ncbi:alpha-glucosidase [Pseudovibrio brasiliensis]|uniref:Alpha glucosidase n=1 Tax=Pseudovibrio brasiliensis TaxID=1898042 RepID=A0ABX8AT44_9HYPH|nr:alpha-glucosidase [Pseudovibrio brasiliensis]QUS58259.1 alpha glucosidase [Pseudovibrio brasiliensis]
MNENWWRNAIIYQVYPRSFQDTNGDGIGDLKGITSRLDHIASLGVDAVWLSPIFTSPMADMGYDVSDYYDIDPLFGTLQDFDDFVTRSHELGLKVIIDQVLSHSSSKHSWFEESRASRASSKADWYVWADAQPDGMPPNNWLSVFGGSAWEWEPRRKQYYLHNFLADQPDLNLHNEEVQEALLRVLRFWLERGVDGFRLDTVNYYYHDQQLRSNPASIRADREALPDVYGRQEHIFSKNRPENIDFLKKLRTLTDEFEGRMMVGEIGDGGDAATKLMAEYTKGSDRLHLCYSFELLSPNYTASHFRNALESYRLAAPDGTACWSFSNHDVPRHVTRWEENAGSSKELAKQTVAMLMSFEGSIGIYQGEELGQQDTELNYDELTDAQAIRFWPAVKGRDGCRTPMVWEATKQHGGFSSAKPWLPVKDPQLVRAVDAAEASNDSVLHSYRSTIEFRKNNDALLTGSTAFLDLPEPILAFHRMTKDQKLTCVFNLSETARELRVEGAVSLSGPSSATLHNQILTLNPNGFAYLISNQLEGLELIS